MKTKKLTFGAMCLAISLLLPQVFHIFATMSSDELKNGSHDQRIPFCGCHSDNY